MGILKKTILIFLIVINVFFSTGCWNFREINKMAVVAGLAIDINKESNKYLVTVEIADGSTSTKEGGVVSKIYSMEGDTIFDAIRGMIAKVDAKLFWSHAKIVVISEAVACKGVVPVIDWINRDSEVRLDMWMFVAKGVRASDIFYDNPSSKDVISYEISDTMKEQKSSGKFVATDLWNFIHDFSAIGIESTAPGIQMINDNGKRHYDIRETAVFKNDKFIGWLNSKDTQYMLILKNKTKEGILVISDSDGSNDKVAFEIFGCKTRSIPYSEGNHINMKVDVNLELGIAEIMSYTDYIQEDKKEIIKSKMEKTLKKDLEYLVLRLQKQYVSDVLGYGDIIGKKHVDYWNRLKGQHDEIFLNTVTEVNVSIHIKGSAKKSKIIEVGSNSSKNIKFGWNK